MPRRKYADRFCLDCEKPIRRTPVRGKFNERCRPCMIRWFKSHPPNPRGAPRGKGNGQWKGGRSFTHKGYVYIRVPKDYPGARSHGYILEHRFIMQEAIGRPLTSREVVHHKNGDRGDNRRENLELMADHGAHLRDQHRYTGIKPGSHDVCPACGRPLTS